MVRFQQKHAITKVDDAEIVIKYDRRKGEGPKTRLQDISINWGAYLCGLHGRGRGGGSYRTRFEVIQQPRRNKPTGPEIGKYHKSVSGFRLFQGNCLCDVQGGSRKELSVEGVEDERL